MRGAVQSGRPALLWGLNFAGSGGSVRGSPRNAAETERDGVPTSGVRSALAVELRM